MNVTIPLFFILGLWFGGIMNAVWYYWWAYLGARKGKPLGKYRWPMLSLLEHYHHSTILYILGFRLGAQILSPILLGMATVFLLDESLAQQHKFALGSDHFRESLLIEVLIISFWILAELFNKFFSVILTAPAFGGVMP